MPVSNRSARVQELSLFLKLESTRVSRAHECEQHNRSRGVVTARGAAPQNTLPLAGLTTKDGRRRSSTLHNSTAPAKAAGERH